MPFCNVSILIVGNKHIHKQKRKKKTTNDMNENMDKTFNN